MTARDIIDQASITHIWSTLGGGELRHGRGKAFWRDDDGYSVSLNEDKNVFFDFATGAGGGILDLVQSVNGCSRSDALRWLASHLNVDLDNQRPLTVAEKREYAIRRAAAERKAQDLTEQRKQRFRALCDRRNIQYLSENGNSAIARTLLATTGGEGDEDAWRDIWRHAHEDLRADAVDRKIQKLKTATPGELVAMQGSAA